MALLVNLSDWLYSSYHSHLSDKRTRLKRTEVIDWFGNEYEFKRFDESNLQPLNPDIEQVATKRKCVFHHDFR